MARNDKPGAMPDASTGPLMSEREVALYLKASARTIIIVMQSRFSAHLRLLYL
jgi:hypothetical protein